ncbi:MAG: hypothetical protein KBA91_01280 [Candidatus Moranbacteria bacterium]|jgi:hypothetical protein|nr:hypothetical protein [Candidatus Moranbacteria bacterium]
MSEVTLETPMSETDSCPTCAHTAKVAGTNEEAAMAFLLALLPVITLTFFGQVGLL